jgi:hypothetical protein
VWAEERSIIDHRLEYVYHAAYVLLLVSFVEHSRMLWKLSSHFFAFVDRSAVVLSLFCWRETEEESIPSSFC